MRMSVLTGSATRVQLERFPGGAAQPRDGEPSPGRGPRSFRIGNRPALLQLNGTARIREGDLVTIAGHERSYAFVGYALANHTTGATYAPVAWPYYFLGGALVLVGIPLSTILVGIPLFAAGVWLVYVARRNARALELLASSPRSASA
jgi:hypothetical protein